MKKNSARSSCDFALQANCKKDYKRDNCTCKRYKKTEFVHKVNKPNAKFSFVEVGVERIKLVPKKRVKKYYLANETILIKDFRVTKKFKSKCVGGAVPGILSSKSVATSQQMFFSDYQNKHVCIKHVGIGACLSKHGSNNFKIEEAEVVKQEANINITQELPKLSTEIIRIKEFPGSVKAKNCSISSNSVIEHIYNLDASSLEKPSGILLNPIDNNLEKEPIKMLKLRHKNSKYTKNQSISEKSLESLRQDFNCTKDYLKYNIVKDKSSHNSVTNQKDVSIESDPPSLEARSYSSTNVCIPNDSLIASNSFDVPKAKYVKDTMIIKEECKEIVTQDVRTMFKMWEKHYNFENDNSKQSISSNDAGSLNRIEKKRKPEQAPVEEKKKYNKIFSLFKKRNKQKSKHSIKGKIVTAGRCELEDGIVLNVDNKRTLEPIALNMKNITKDPSNILHKSWLSRFISKSESVEAQESVQLRWGNKLYGASSATVPELINYVHNDAATIMRSKSKIKCDVSEFHDDNPKDKVKFMQDIKAWMMPNTMYDAPILLPIIKNETLKKNDNSFYCNKSLKTKSQTIEFFLHADDTLRKLDASSEYITINIPEGYFSEDSEYQKQSTDEEVYNIVEYETHNSKENSKEKNTDRQLDTGDYTDGNMQVQVSLNGSKSPQYRDVITQHSTVYSPNEFDVIGVGIITQKDFRHTQYPMIKFQDCLTNEESKQILKPHKNRMLAESYLQDYCRNILPLNLDLLTTFTNGSKIYTSSEYNSNISENKRYSESCSNVCKDSRAPIISSCKMLESSECRTCTVEDVDEDKIHKFLHRFKLPGYFCSHEPECIRACPKDSIEVYKMRRMQAEGNKSNWGVNEEYKIPRIEPCLKDGGETTDMVKKRVRVRNVNSTDEIPQTCEKPVDGILQYKGANCEASKSYSSLKQARICSDAVETKVPTCSKPCQIKETPTCATSSLGDQLPQCSIRKQISTQAPSFDNQCDRKHQSSSMTSFSRKCDGHSSAIKSNTDQSCNFDRVQIKITPSSQGSRSNLSNAKCLCNCKKHVTSNKDMRNLNNSSEGGRRCKLLNCPNMRNSVIPCESPLPFMKRVPPNAKEIISPPTRHRNIINEKHGIHLRTRPQSKNDNSNSYIRQNKDFDIMKLNSRENIRIRLKQDNPSTEEIRKEFNIKVKDEDGRTLYERKDYKRTNGIANKNESLVRDMYRGSYVNRITAANIVSEQKCFDIQSEKSNTSVSNIVEINLTLKFKPQEKKTEFNRSQYDYDCNDEEKSDIHGIIDSPQEVYTFEEESNNQVKVKEDRKGLDICIQNMKQTSNTSLKNESQSYYTPTKSEKLVSTSYNEVFLREQAYSVDTTTLDIPNYEIDKEPTPNDKTKENYSTPKISNTSIIINNKTISHNNPKTNKESISIISDINSYEDRNIVNKTHIYKRIDSKNLIVNETIEGIVSKNIVSILKNLSENEKKEVLKVIFETVENMKEKSKTKKFKRIQHMLHAVLTSDSSDFEDTCLYRSLPSKCKENNLLNCRTCDSNFTQKKLSQSANKSKDENLSTHCSNVSQCVCSDITEKLEMIHNNIKFGCCCESKRLIEENRSSLSNRSKFIEVETKDSRNIKLESVMLTSVSNTLGTRSITKQETSCSAYPNKPEVKGIDKEKGKIIYFSSDKVLFFLSDSAETIEEDQDPEHIDRPEDILQLKETKKAVLEIYSQKRISNTSAHITAKLPKFVTYKQRQMRTLM